MSKQVSAGLLMYRQTNGKLEVFLMHPGGPFFKNKDEGFWSVPKGLIDEGEKLIDTAKREFEEETGVKPPENEKLFPLGSIKYKSGKTVHAWAFKTDVETVDVKSGTFKVEWPPKTGKISEFPETDRAEFFSVKKAKEKITQNQAGFIDRLVDHLK